MKFKKGDRVYVEHLDEFGTVTGYVPGQQICVSVLLDINESFGKTLGFNEKELQLVNKAFTDKWISNIREGLKGCLEAMKKPKFAVGDKVINGYGDIGVVTEIHSLLTRPLTVKYDDYTKVYYLDGRVRKDAPDDADIVLYTSNPINPSHYRAEGIPEAIDIMRGLMTDEQLEGFLWGNIIKYAYRYGRKGDKKETAEKIEWYAEKLALLNIKGRN